MKIKPIKRDAVAINEGHWVGEIPHMGDLKLKVKGRSTAEHEAAFDKHLRAVPRDQRDRVGSPKKEARIRALGLACAETVLLDWDGIEDDKGKPVKFNKDIAKDWLTNPEFEHFLDAVLFAAQVVDNLQQDVDGALTKNS